MCTSHHGVNIIMLYKHPKKHGLLIKALTKENVLPTADFPTLPQKILQIASQKEEFLYWKRCATCIRNMFGNLFKQKPWQFPLSQPRACALLRCSGTTGWCWWWSTCILRRHSLTQVLGEWLVGVVGGVQQLQGLVDLIGLHNLVPDRQ